VANQRVNSNGFSQLRKITHGYSLLARAAEAGKHYSFIVNPLCVCASVMGHTLALRTA
jgi:hypothetical protein